LKKGELATMSKNTSISIGHYFEDFIGNQISTGRYKNKSEVIRAGLRLLENEESKVIMLKKAIQEGIDSGLVDDFDAEENLKMLKLARKKNG
jgi:antitoxin ParD1/3/4